MFRAVVSASFENMQKANDVAFDVAMRMGHGIAHASLRRKVNDPWKTLHPEERFDRRSIREVELDESKPGVAPQPLQPGCLEGRIVVRVHVVESDNLVAPLQQPFRNMVADKARCARDEMLHGASPGRGESTSTPSRRNCSVRHGSSRTATARRSPASD